jgi:hypothetical protein
VLLLPSFMAGFVTKSAWIWDRLDFTHSTIQISRVYFHFFSANSSRMAISRPSTQSGRTTPANAISRPSTATRSRPLNRFPPDAKP